VQTAGRFFFHQETFDGGKRSYPIMNYPKELQKERKQLLRFFYPHTFVDSNAKKKMPYSTLVNKKTEITRVARPCQ
jgi:hypothetical protein